MSSLPHLGHFITSHRPSLLRMDRDRPSSRNMPNHSPGTCGNHSHNRLRCRQDREGHCSSFRIRWSTIHSPSFSPPAVGYQATVRTMNGAVMRVFAFLVETIRARVRFFTILQLTTVTPSLWYDLRRALRAIHASRLLHPKLVICISESL